MSAISSTISSGPYAGTGAQTVFPFDFTAASTLEVGAKIDDVEAGGFSVTLNGTGGSVTFSTPPANGSAILLYSKPDFIQASTFETEGDYDMETVNRINQRSAIRDLVIKSRALMLADGQTASDIPPVENGKYLATDGAGGFLWSDGTGADAGLRTDLAQPNTLIAFRSSRGPAITRLLRDRVGEVVSAKDYVVGDGNAVDTEAYQALVNFQPAEIVYPEGCSIAVDATILWPGNQTHRFANNARIVGDVAGHAVRGLGYPDLLVLSANAAIARNAMSFAVTGTVTLAAGDDFYLYDTVTAEFDMNRVRKVVGQTIYTKRPINYNFATSANIRVYKLANAARNIQVFGGEIRNENASLSAHGLGFLNATDILLSGVTATQTGGIGFDIAVTSRWQAINCSAIRTGASGMCVRNSKDFSIVGFVGRDPERDESLSFYKNCTHGLVDAPDIEQYLSGEHASGAGQAGNCILLDERICDVTINNPRLHGSATYPLFINNQSDRNRVFQPDIALANLGGIRIAATSNDNFIGSGTVTDIINATDSEQAGIATAAIQDDATCSGNVLGNALGFPTQVARYAGVGIRQDGTPVAPPAAAQANTTAADLAALKTDFNALLAKLRAGKLMA